MSRKRDSQQIAVLTAGILAGHKAFAGHNKHFHICRTFRLAEEAEITIQGRGQQTCFPACTALHLSTL